MLCEKYAFKLCVRPFNANCHFHYIEILRSTQQIISIIYVVGEKYVVRVLTANAQVVSDAGVLEVQVTRRAFVPSGVLAANRCEIQETVTSLGNLTKHTNTHTRLKTIDPKLYTYRPGTDNVGVGLTGESPASFCHIGELGGFESTSHLSETSRPSRNGYPKPGVREMANEGVSADFPEIRLV